MARGHFHSHCSRVRAVAFQPGGQGADGSLPAEPSKGSGCAKPPEPQVTPAQHEGPRRGHKVWLFWAAGWASAQDFGIVVHRAMEGRILHMAQGRAWESELSHYGGVCVGHGGVPGPAILGCGYSLFAAGPRRESKARPAQGLRGACSGYAPRHPGGADRMGAQQLQFPRPL